MRRILVTGGVLTFLVAGSIRVGFGAAALVPALLFGLLAVAIQIGAGRAMRGATAKSYPEFLKSYGIGMGLRLAGVVVLVVAIVARREFFDPLPTAIGFLGVLIPLLFLEARPAR